MNGSAPLSAALAAILSETFRKSTLTQRTLGAASGISQSQMSKHLRGERVLDVNELDAVCNALGLDIVHVVALAAAPRSDRP